MGCTEESRGSKRGRCEPRLTQRGRAAGRSSTQPPPTPLLPEPLRSPRPSAARHRPPRRSPDLVGASHAVHGGCSAGRGAAPGSPSVNGRSLGRRSALSPILAFLFLGRSLNSFFSLSLFSPPSLPPNPSCATAAPRARPPPPPPAARSRSLSAANRRCARTCPRYGVSAAAPREGRK